MENNHNSGAARDGADHQHDWQLAERDKSDDNDVNDTDNVEQGDVADNDADEPTVSDWGDIDPQNNGMPSSNDPTAPGSAV
jgi:hypothetical protein